MIEFKQLNLKKDQEIVVETSKGKFIAIFNKLSQNGARLDVVNVKDENGKPFGAFKYFFERDVISVTTIGEGYETPPASPTHASLPHELTPPQLAIISNALTNFTYIQQADSNYFQALEDISKQFVIGISADCCRGRYDNVTLLGITTGEKIYIFDLPMLNKEKTINELKVILEGTSHLKIVYDGRSLVDNFKIKFGFDIQPIFDVMLAAAQFYCSEDVLKLRKVVKSVLGIDIDVGEIKEFSTRPLSQKFLHSFATRIAYLVPMYHKLSMKGFSFAFGNFSVQAASSFKDFHLSLSMTDSEKIEEQKRSGQLMTVDYSIFGEQSEESI